MHTLLHIKNLRSQMKQAITWSWGPYENLKQVVISVIRLPSSSGPGLVPKIMKRIIMMEG